MKLGSTFISKMVALALAGTQFSSAALAQHHAPEIYPHQTHHYEMYEGSEFEGAGHGEGNDTFLTVEKFKKLEMSLSHNPHTAIDQLVEVANHNFKGTQNGMSKFAINLKYSNQLPAGDTTLLELTQPTSDQVSMQLLVHSSAKKNPFFLLDALIELKNLYDIQSISANGEGTPVYGHKEHPSHHHAPLIDYKFVTYSLQHSLGLPHAQETTGSHHLGNYGDISYFKNLTPMELIEIYSNASAGSVFSQRRLAELDSNNFHLIKRGFSSFAPIKKLTPEAKKKFLFEYAQAKGVTLSGADTYEVALKKFIDQVDLANKNRLDTLNFQAKKVYQQQINEYKAGAAEREAIVKGPALNEMIKANDRQGVAAAMEKMLPWAIMEPVEKRFWSDFVDSIRHPNYDNAQILFRGIDGDEKLQAVTDKAGNIVNVGLLSKRLTAGSGSHFFKLKGLPETFETFGTYGVNIGGKRVTPLTQPHTLTKMMRNHANNPAGSPFISLTYSLDTAFSFSSAKYLKENTDQEFTKAAEKLMKSNGAGGLATIRIDPRRLLINSISSFTTELEVLGSMFIFPDEVIHLERGLNIAGMVNSSYKVHKSVSAEEYYARARQAVLAKTGIQLPENYYQYTQNGQKNFVDGIKNMEVLFNRVAIDPTIRCERALR